VARSRLWHRSDHGGRAVPAQLDAALRQLSDTLHDVEQTNQELEQAHAEADRLSRVDPLTGVYNRRHFSELLSAELGLTDGGSVAVLLLDLDHFKGVNDRYGHLTGDAVLQAAAGRIASIIRSSDCLARWGGEEFAILAPGTEADEASALAERARAALADTPVKVEGVVIELTTSVGVAVAGGPTQTSDGLLDAADEALYGAKRAGRNCVRMSPPVSSATGSVVPAARSSSSLDGAQPRPSPSTSSLSAPSGRPAYRPRRASG
jgi:two-component system, cell cycle response regulator